MVNPLISFKKVSKHFKRHKAVTDISLDIYPNEVFGVLGVNGAGKTTLLRTLIGYYKIDQGVILYEGKDIHSRLDLIRRVFGFCSQDNCFYPDLTCIENLRYFGTLYQIDKKTIEDRANRLLKMVRLTSKKNHSAGWLSGGMKRRLDLACAMMHDPKIIILDEPCAGLDPLHRNNMWELIKKIRFQGKTVIISSHLLTEIEHICHRVGIFVHGQLKSVGSPDQLKEQYSHNYEIHLETNPMNYEDTIKFLQTKIPIARTVKKGHKIIIFTRYPEQGLHWILHYIEDKNISLIDVDINKPSILEVFEALVTD